ncbi:MAG: divergent polysaccharide deacetylase family protein [Deltaproteobacteria bacterium]|nr:divergent polysaccharide deacetylase family protein [Deltaproteobacteria bacterium]
MMPTRSIWTQPSAWNAITSCVWPCRSSSPCQGLGPCPLARPNRFFLTVRISMVTKGRASKAGQTKQTAKNSKPSDKAKKSAAKKRSAPTRKKARPKFLSAGLFAMGAVLVLSMTVLAWILIQPSIRSKPVVATTKEDRKPSPVAQTRDPKPETAKPAKASVRQAVTQYEEHSGETFAIRVKEVELSLVQTLFTLGLTQGQVEEDRPEERRHRGESFEYRRYVIRGVGDPLGFIQRLRENLTHLVDGAGIKILNESSTAAEVRLDGVAVLFLGLEANGLRPVPKPALEPKARMAIIIDDMGESLKEAKRLAALDFDLTFSILPFTTRAVEVARLAKDSGLEVLLHLPMQPKGYPGVDPGPGALFVDMGPDEIRDIVRRELDRVPGASGANNHMGSLFTEHRSGMEVVVGEIASRGLFFVDSITTPNTVARAVCRDLNCRYLNRNVFLDNDQDVEAILDQLRKAESMAKRIGRAVAIGHPYPETLTALELWSRERDPGVAVCRAGDLAGR